MTAIVATTCEGCAGSGTEHYNEDGIATSCRYCGGSGDQLSYGLLGAYQRGLADGLAWLEYALRQAEHPSQPMTGARLREELIGR